MIDLKTKISDKMLIFMRLNIMIAEILNVKVD